VRLSDISCVITFARALALLSLALTQLAGRTSCQAQSRAGLGKSKKSQFPPLGSLEPFLTCRGPEHGLLRLQPCHHDPSGDARFPTHLGLHLITWHLTWFPERSVLQRIGRMPLVIGACAIHWERSRHAFWYVNDAQLAGCS
jgi:hypothetical protein